MAEDPGRVRKRAPWATAVIAVLFALLGFAVVAQLRSADSDPLAGARETELVRILGDLDAQAERLSAEVAGLEAAERQLQADSSDEAALDQARQRTEVLGILAGTLPAAGPGVVVSLSGSAITAATLLDAVQELRDAGAEALEVGGVRVVATTSFTADDNGTLIVDGERLAGPVLIQAIGDAATMDAALRIPGGLVDAVATDGGEAVIEVRDSVRIESVIEPAEPQFAQPQTP